MKICDICKKPIDQYGTSFVKIQLVKNYQSQGYPDEFVEAGKECCGVCALTAIKNILIGDSASAQEKFEQFLRKKDE